MHLKIVDGNDNTPHRQANLMSYVIDGCVAFDAGAIGLLPLVEQKKIKTIFLSHSHIDHIATLALFIDNVFSPGPECVTLYANATTLCDLKQHIFNDKLWPDLVRLSQVESPFIEFREIAAGQALEVDGLRVTAFDVNHTIPTLGFVAASQAAAVALIADTAPCDGIWQLLAEFETLKAVFLEISFPNAMQWLADKSKHLTPAQFRSETHKLSRAVDWYVTHVKPEYAPTIKREVEELRIPRCQFAIASHAYNF